MEDQDQQTYLVIGDSTVGLFKLVYGSQIRVLRYSTATAKGLGQNNKNSQLIWDMLSTKYARVNLSAVIWLFGNVDTKFSYYYKLCKEWDGNAESKPDPFLLMKQCASTYMQFVKKVHDTFLATRDTKPKTVVIGAEPNGAAPCLIFDQCVKYYIAPDTDVNKRRVQESVTSHRPELLRRQYNTSLEQICKENGFDYIDLDDKILKEESLTSNPQLSVVKDEYIDISPTSAHLNWEGNLKLYIAKLRETGICICDTLDLDQTRDEYLKEKQHRKRKSATIIEEIWQRSLITHIDERKANQT
jgi:hypothetical protein